jgi:hypothetical protein
METPKGVTWTLLFKLFFAKDGVPAGILTYRIRHFPYNIKKMDYKISKRGKGIDVLCTPINRQAGSTKSHGIKG